MQTRETKNITYHLGNVLTVITDEKRMMLNGSNYSHYESVVVSVTDYSPFGVSLTGRTFTTIEGYRYGFNGQEKESEITGQETHTSAEFWMYDARVGRRWQLDPKSNKGISSYACFALNPIFYNDPYGDTLKISGQTLDAKGFSALELFVSTKEGYSELAKYATKGQKIGNFEFKENGILSEQVDLTIQFGNAGDGGETGTKIDNDKGGNSGVNIYIDIFSGKGWESNNEVWNKLITITHEIYIHADSKASDYLDNCSLDNSNLSKQIVRTMGLSRIHYDHVAVRDAAIKAQQELGTFLKSNYAFPSKAYSVLSTISTTQKWGFTSNQIISQMWDYTGGLKINPKTGKYEGSQ